MNNKTLKVLIADNTAEYGVKLAAKLQDNGIYAYTRRNDADVIMAAVIKDRPDVVIVELALPGTDALLLIRDLKNKNYPLPAFIVTSDISNSFVERQVLENGASYYIARPFTPETIYSAIMTVCNDSPSGGGEDVEVLVTDVIRKLGVPAHIKGYQYIRTAIISSVFDRSLMESVTKNLYPAVAERYNTTSSRVERAIRHAIEIAWERGSYQTFSEYFGYSSGGHHSRPTNSEFIALITDKLRLQLKSK